MPASASAGPPPAGPGPVRPAPDRPAAPESARRQPTAAGFTIVLPPGWHHIPVRRGTDDAIKKAVDAAARSAPKSMPRDKLTAYRLDQTRRLADLARDARRKHGTDLYVPMGLVRGVPVPASFLVSELSLGSVEPVDPELMISAVAGDDGESSKVTVASAAASRTERIVGPDPSRPGDHGSRRVRYLIAVPGDPDRYLAVAFATVGGGDPDDAYARQLAELFDAMMSTWRWTWAAA